MDVGQALLQAILADPQDDLPRLAYADWLEENGRQERAEFIRAQVACWNAFEARRGHRELCDCDRCERYDGLYVSMRKRYAPGPDGALPFADDDPVRLIPASAPRSAWDWQRGFVSAYRGPLQVWLDYGPAVVRAHPVEKVRLTDREPRRRVDGYFWRRGPEAGEAHHDTRSSLPHAVWDAVLALDGRGYEGYPTEEAAWGALLAWAKAYPLTPAP